MTKLAVLVLLVPALAAAENHLMDNKQTVTYDCGKDAQVNIMGNDNTVTLTGACDSVNVSGNHNTVTGESAKAVSLSGNDNALTIATVVTANLTGQKNQLTWQKASATDKGPKVNSVGTGNKISGKEPAKK